MSLKKADALSADILDEDFIKVFQPLHFIQKLLGFHRVNIDYRFVTTPSINYKLYSCTVWVINAISLVGYVDLCHSVLGSANIDSMVKLTLSIIGVLNTVIAWQNNFCYENLNSQLYVKLQRIDRKLKMSNTVPLNNRFKVFSLSMALFVSCIIWILVCNFILAKEICFPYFYVMFMAMASSIEMYLLFQILFFIIIRVIHVNHILRAKLSFYTKHSDTVKEYYKSKHVWTVNAHEKFDNHGFQELVYGVHSILDTLADVIILFRFPVFAYTSQALLCNLALVQCIVDSIKDKVFVSGYLWAATLPIHAALGIIIVIMAITAGFLSSKLEETRKLSLYIKSALNDGTSRDHSKQLLTLLSKERCEISIYNIFTLDYRLPLEMFAITATYTIVLLQLATL